MKGDHVMKNTYNNNEMRHADMENRNVKYDERFDDTMNVNYDQRYDRRYDDRFGDNYDNYNDIGADPVMNAPNHPNSPNYPNDPNYPNNPNNGKKTSGTKLLVATIMVAVVAVSTCLTVYFCTSANAEAAKKQLPHVSKGRRVGEAGWAGAGGGEVAARSVTEREREGCFPADKLFA